MFLSYRLRSHWRPGFLFALAAIAGCQASARPVKSTGSVSAWANAPANAAVGAIPSRPCPVQFASTSSRPTTTASSPRPIAELAERSTSSQASYAHSKPLDSDDGLLHHEELQLGWLLGEVQARNQSLQAMRAVWLAAAERYPQERALDDPVFSSMVAPASLNSGIAGVPGNSAGYVVGGSQKLPWAGKRALRGDAAIAESRAAGWDVEDTRLALIEATGIAYYDYYLARQQLALNTQNRAKLREFHDIAARKYEANLAPQQDVLQAEVELAELARRQIELERWRRIAIARLNTLMHRPPDAFLPPAPAYIDAQPLVLSAAYLRTSALSRRPDLAALSAKVRAEQSRLALVHKEFYPDFEVFGRYDNFWSQASLRGQVGINMNVPLNRDKRYAAVREAEWRLSQRRAEYEQRVDDINREVQTAFERFDEAQQTVRLYTHQVLPAASKNVASAFAAYEASGGDFLRLVAAQRQFIALQERYQESIADYHRRRVELERVVGQPLSSIAEPIPPRQPSDYSK
ncbi:MAG TPA: TolC family protein [Pirellulales bacterium]|nr:TolC family protein [Pirellulales bacterium]